MTPKEAVASARFWLGTTRVDPSNVFLVRRRLREAGASLADIDTDEANLAKLEQAAAREKLKEEETGIDKILPLALRIVEEGREEVPEKPHRTVSSPYKNLDWIRDSEGRGADGIKDDLAQDRPDDEDGKAILEQACAVVILTREVFALAKRKGNGEEEPLDAAEVQERWEDISTALEDAGSSLLDLGLDDACLHRLLEIHAALSRPDPPPQAPAMAAI